ncbi:calpain-like cysteine peptidase, Clan CA, family C2, (fragment), partial [Trypanosoma brucei gambiense DAL972]
KDYEFHVTFLFSANSLFEPLDKATAAQQDDGILCEVTIYPLETQRFVKGEITGYESKIDALLLSDDYFRLNEDRNPERYFRHTGPFKATSF